MDCCKIITVGWNLKESADNQMRSVCFKNTYATIRAQIILCVI